LRYQLAESVKNDRMNFEDLEQYDYVLPPELIRKKGFEPRDGARLFVYDTETDTVTHDFFYNLAKYLPEKSLVVLNETRVVPARLWLRKETGGKIEVFVLANEWDGGMEIPVLVDRKCIVGQKLLFPNGDFLEVIRQEESRFFVRLEFGGLTAENELEQRNIQRFNRCDGYLYRLLDIYGETPVPHYLEGEMKESEQALRKRYQTVFAKTGASVAAPTASLHFTDRVFESLDAKGIDIAKVTLDVGQGTFAPLRPENFKTRKLHRERIEVSEETAAKLDTSLGSSTSKSGRPIVAVGTTALRTLESISASVIPIRQSADEESRSLQYRLGSFASVQDDKRNKGRFRAYSGSTDIFISPPHEFRSADMLITNFHLPKTSLMLLVDAFLEWKGAKRRIIPLYEEAIRERYAFYSFGDSMLIR
jgi:S-adenosylmethionine:tRNA ribosyltransferase-isomerase